MNLRPTPAPTITADDAQWYVDQEPVFFAGSLFYPAGPQIFFNANEMVRSGYYQGVPIYSRRTIEPYSQILVPLKGSLMKPYERRRSGELAGTVGSTMPSFPVDRTANTAIDESTLGIPEAPGPPTNARPRMTIVDVNVSPDRSPEPLPVPTATAGTEPSPPTVTPAPKRRTGNVKRDLYIDYDDRKWFQSGPAVVSDPARFVIVGRYHDLPVYSDRRNPEGTVYVPVASALESLLTPYSRR